MQALIMVLMSYPWVWAGLFFATLGALLICLAKMRQLQKSADETQADVSSVEEREKNTVLEFLVEQFDRTKRLNDNVYFRHDELDRHACSLRSAYLKIEEKNLKNHIDHKSYHLSINKSLVKLLKIIRGDAKKNG